MCVPNIDKLTIRKFQLELGEFAPGLEPLEFVSVECSPNIYIYIYIYICIYILPSLLFDSDDMLSEWGQMTEKENQKVE